MTDIEQILLEIKKHLAECWECTPKNDFIKGRVHEAKHLSEFIKTIPIFKVGQTIVPKNHQERGLTITDIRDGRYYSYDLEICPIVEQHEWEIEKKPSDELEKAAEEHAKILYGDNWMKSEYTQDCGFRAISNFKAGAKWQEENDNICYEEIFEKVVEKQCEQKTTNKIKPRFKVGDTIRPKGSMAEYTIESIYGECYHGKGWGLTIGCDEDYELVEQKPTDKVEPKFKVGDWVVWDNKISCHVDNIYQGKESLMYTITDVCNMTRSYSVKGFDNNAHLWTIQDAKYGDIIACDKIVLIVDHIGDFEGESTIYSWYFADSNKFYGMSPKHPDKWSIEGFHPAAKEQCDFLFQKMKEDGYEWDAENKELRKIEQNPEIKDDVLSHFAFYQYDNDTIYLSSLFVRGSDRRHGYGSKVLNAAEEVAKTFGISKIRLKVERNTWVEEWYKKNGYEYLSSEGEYDWLEKRVEQKPVEWSKRQVVNVLTSMLTERIKPLMKKSLDGTINDREEMFMSALTEIRSFVNSPSFQVGKEWSWSEEDEEHVNSLLKRLKGLCRGKFATTRFAVSEDEEWLKSLKPKSLPVLSKDALSQAKKDAYNTALDKIEYHSGEPTFDDGWSAAIDYITKQNIITLN